MQVITIITFLISCYLFFSTLNIEGISSEISAVGTLAFALFPFVGVTYVLFPVADLPAIMFYLAGLYTYKKKRFLISSIMFGCALITHKALWPVIGLFYLFQLVDILKKHGNMARFSIYLVCSFLPLLILWISGALYYSSLNWIISSNVAGEMATKSSLPVFDGIIGTIMQGGIKEISKGIFLLLLFILSIVLLVYGIKYKINDFLYLGYPIVLSIIALGIILNQSEIWAIVRFGRLLVLPLFLVISKTYFVNNIFSKRIFTNVVLPVLFISLLTNFFYIWYLQIYYQ